MPYALGSTWKDYFLVNDIRHIATGNFYVGTISTIEHGPISFKTFLTDKINAGEAIWLRGRVEEYNDQPQMQCFEMRPVTKEEISSSEIREKLVPTSPNNREWTMQQLFTAIQYIGHKWLREICDAIYREYRFVLKDLPAGIRMHHSYLGGWIDHTEGMLESAQALANIYGDVVNKDLLTAGVLLHDIGKVKEFQLSPLGLVSSYTPAGNGLGHPLIGTMLVHEYAVRLGCENDDMVLALENMIIAHSGKYEWGMGKLPFTYEAMILQAVDFLDSRADVFRHINETTDIGTCTDIIRSEGGRMFRPNPDWEG